MNLALDKPIATDVMAMPALNPFDPKKDCIRAVGYPPALPGTIDRDLRIAFVYYKHCGITVERLNLYNYLRYRIGLYALSKWRNSFYIVAPSNPYYNLLNKLPGRLATWLNKCRWYARDIYESGREVRLRLF